MGGRSRGRVGGEGEGVGGQTVFVEDGRKADAVGTVAGDEWDLPRAPCLLCNFALQQAQRRLQG